jgi:hypothetical protein
LEADVVAKSGKAHHPIVTLTGNSDDRISGLVFEITDAELESADAHEVEAYERVLAPARARVATRAMPGWVDRNRYSITFRTLTSAARGCAIPMELDSR